MSTRGDIIRGAGGHLKRNNDLGVGIGHPHGGDEGDIRVQMVDSSPHLYARAGGQWYGINLSTITDDTMRLGDSRDYLSINPDVGIELYNSHAKVATFGETTTVKDINLTGKIGVTSASTENICIGTWSTGDPDVTGATYNIVIGTDAGNSIVSGANSNTLIGRQAGKLIEEGQSNVCIGSSTGTTIVDSFGHVFIGTAAGLSGSNNHAIAIGGACAAAGFGIAIGSIITAAAEVFKIGNVFNNISADFSSLGSGYFCISDATTGNVTVDGFSHSYVEMDVNGTVYKVLTGGTV